MMCAGSHCHEAGSSRPTAAEPRRSADGVRRRETGKGSGSVGRTPRLTAALGGPGVIEPMTKPAPRSTVAKKRDKVGRYLVAYACTACCRSFKRSAGPQAPEFRKCPNCGLRARHVGRFFKAPPADDAKQWAKVRFLVEHGFPFHRIYVGGRSVPYPETLEQAKQFVKTYRRYGLLKAS